MAKATKHCVQIVDAKGSNILAINEKKLVWADSADGGNPYSQWVIVTDGDHVLIRNSADASLNLSGNAEGEMIITDRTTGAGLKALSIMKSGSDFVFRLHGTTTSLAVSSPSSTVKVNRFKLIYLNKCNGQIQKQVKKSKSNDGIAAGFIVLIVLACAIVLCLGAYAAWKWWNPQMQQEPVIFKANPASMGPASGSLFEYFE